MLTYDKITKKIVTTDRVLEQFTPAFREQHKIVFTNGCFDLLHRGHVYLLSRAREMGNMLVVGLNSDASVTKLKGPGRPIIDEQSRAVVLGALAFVDYIIIFQEDTPIQLIKDLQPDILIKGADYKLDEIVGYPEVYSWGGKIETIPFMEGHSTSSIIRKST